MEFDRSEKQTRGSVWAGPTSVILATLATAFELLSCLPITGIFGPALVFVLAIGGVLTGWIALKNARDNPENRVFGAIGLVLSLINLFISFIMMGMMAGLMAMILAISLSQ